MFTYKIFTDTEALEQLCSNWKSLVIRSETATPFQTYEWVSSWWSCLGRFKKLYLIAIYEGQDLVGLYPGYTQPGVLKVLSPIGKGLSDYLHPLIQTGYEQTISEEILNLLIDQKEFQFIDFHQIRETHPLCENENVQKAVQSECFILNLPSTFEAYIQTLSKSMRYEAKRTEKGDFKHNLASVKTVKTEEEAKEGLSLLFDLHRLRWKKKGLPGVFFMRSIQNFHEHYIRQALLSNQLKLAIYRHGSDVVGGIYVIRVGKTSYFYQSGFNPLYKALSPGSVLVSHSIRETIEEEGNCFDFLRGAESYKARWKPQNRYKNLRIMLSLESIRGDIATKVNSSWTHLSMQVLKKIQQTSI